MENLPIENPRKYGSWDDDIDELAAGLDGRPVSPKSNGKPSSSAANGSSNDPVDESFFELTRDSARKYGTF